MSTEAPVALTPAPPDRRPRRRLRAALVVFLTFTVLACGSVGGIGWHFSGVAIEVAHGDEYPLTVLEAGSGTVTLPKEPETSRPGIWGLVWKDGRALLGPVVGGDSSKVVRKVTSVKGRLAKGLAVDVDHWVYGGDPKRALGIEFQDVKYASKLGPMPAWLLPGKSSKSTWVIGVHGRNADKAETFRVMRTVHGLGLPMLSIAYRNDIGAPASSDGKNHLGDTEWQDVASAVAYARANGATGVVLHGWSMGGAMVMTTLRRDPALRANPTFVRGIVLDSPVMDWGATLDKQGDARDLPRFLTFVAKQTLEQRIGIDLEAFDQRRHAARHTTPTLLFTANDDETVANAPAYAFVKAAPAGMVTHIPTAGGHTDSWNVDPAAYESALTTFLTKVR